MITFLVMLNGDDEHQYEFLTQDDAERFIEESPHGGDWVELISLDSLNPDLI